MIEARVEITADAPEIQAAVAWWRDILRTASPQDNGDGLQSAFATLAARLMPPVTEEQLEAFAAALSEGIVAYFGLFSRGGWMPDNPNWGSGLRVLACDYHPEGPLAAAAKVAGISDLHFPVKTVMWVDPGCVRVGHGYGARPVTIYPVADRT